MINVFPVGLDVISFQKHLFKFYTSRNEKKATILKLNIYHLKMLYKTMTKYIFKNQYNV